MTTIIKRYFFPLFSRSIDKMDETYCKTKESRLPWRVDRDERLLWFLQVFMLKPAFDRSRLSNYTQRSMHKKQKLPNFFSQFSFENKKYFLILHANAMKVNLPSGWTTLSDLYN